MNPPRRITLDGNQAVASVARMTRNIPVPPEALFREGEVLVTDKTDPDWEPTMKKAAAIVTNRGGRTCCATVASRCFFITDPSYDYGEDISGVPHHGRAAMAVLAKESRQVTRPNSRRPV